MQSQCSYSARCKLRVAASDASRAIADHCKGLADRGDAECRSTIPALTSYVSLGWSGVHISGVAVGSPNFLHFVGLDRGRHPGLPWGVAGVTRRSTYTESPSQSSNTFGDSELARQPEMCHGQSNTTGVLSSFCCPYVLSTSLYTLHVTCNNMGK
jgi:hypothetical protein